MLCSHKKALENKTLKAFTLSHLKSISNRNKEIEIIPVAKQKISEDTGLDLLTCCVGVNSYCRWVALTRPPTDPEAERDLSCDKFLWML